VSPVGGRWCALRRLGHPAPGGGGPTPGGAEFWPKPEEASGAGACPGGAAGPVAWGTSAGAAAFGARVGARRAPKPAASGDNMRLYSCGAAAAHYVFIIPGLVWNSCKVRKNSLDPATNRRRLPPG